MAIWSVYKYGRNSYDYYEDGRDPSSTHAGAPPGKLRAAMGATPEQCAWPLPAGAKKIGSGPLPQGRIASTSSGPGMGDLPSIDATTLGIAAVIAYVAWRALK
jgi:hypothetical protein